MANQPILSARPVQVTQAAPTGLRTLPVDGKRASYLYVPRSYDPEQPAPLVLLLHGAGGHAHDGLAILRGMADTAGLILAAPASQDSTWDVISQKAYGADVQLTDRSLAHVFAHYAIDPARIAIGGFSDGASYALTLGLANGDMFTHVMAFSPGFVGHMTSRGEPKIFMSHGTEDEILPVNPCSRSIEKQLRRLEYDLTYVEFDDGHVIPPDITRAAIDWFLDRA
jgi:phospholipase/carboxylesterase